MKTVRLADLARVISSKESLMRLFERDWCRAIHGVTASYWLKQSLCEDLEQIAQWCLVDFFNLKHSEKSRVSVRIDDSLNSSIWALKYSLRSEQATHNLKLAITALHSHLELIVGTEEFELDIADSRVRAEFFIKKQGGLRELIARHDPGFQLLESIYMLPDEIEVYYQLFA